MTAREVGYRPGDDGPVRRIRLQRSYDSPVEDVWDACTDPERINRWFLEVTGDLRAGGPFQLKGNAGGEILACQPPRLLRLTWVYGDGPASEVELRLTPSSSTPGSRAGRHRRPAGRRRAQRGGVGHLGDGDRLGDGAVSPDRPASEWFDEGRPDVQELAEQCNRAWSEAVARQGRP